MLCSLAVRHCKLALCHPAPQSLTIKKMRLHLVHTRPQVAALVADHHRDKEPQASDDAAGAMWVSVKEMETLQSEQMQRARHLAAFRLNNATWRNM